MKKATISALVLLLAAVASIAFYFYAGKEYVFRFSESQLQEKLNAKLLLKSVAIANRELVVTLGIQSLIGHSQSPAAK
ncbi:MAG: hypothetical protein ACU837_06900 [Gammaproteobacteria bacterium]